MSFTIEVDGKEFEGFTEASAEITLDTLSGKFSFSSTELDQGVSPFKVGQECIIRVEGETVVSGFIETINVRYDSDSHEIILEGRDRTADVIDSSVPESIEFQSDISFVDVIKQTLNKSGITDIDVIDNVGTLTNFTSGEISSQGTGETIFSFLQDLAKKKQVFLITDGEGNIVISQSSGVLVNENLINNPENQNSNILSASVLYDDRQRFSEYTVKSQSNNAADSVFGGLVSGSSAVNKEGKASDDEGIRTSRKHTIISDKAYSNSQLQERANWEVNIRRISSRIYNCTVQGHKRSDSSKIWRPNQLVQIIDTFSQINDILLVNTVKFTLSLGDEAGSRTELTFVNKNAYKPESQIPISEQKSSDFGSAFNL
jgi:prophage tail gpP-like protein